MPNVDVTQPLATRVATFWDLLGQMSADLDGASQPAAQDNAKRFLLHVAAHEGAMISLREQMAGGPARSFFQFEAHRAKDTLTYAQPRPFMAKLAAVGGCSVDDLAAATAALPSYGTPDAPFFPDGNLVQDLLAGNDLFGIYLARVAFKKIPAAIPVGNAAHGQYWYQYWKVSGGDPSQLVATFAQEADKVDAAIPVL
ncbi:MAG: hypothetical protein H7841_13145 [Magnetospirillum sp. WYHS-4]